MGRKGPKKTTTNLYHRGRKEKDRRKLEWRLIRILAKKGTKQNSKSRTKPNQPTTENILFSTKATKQIILI